MMRGFATFYGKHRIIAKQSGTTSFRAKQMHHIAEGDASFKNIQCYALIEEHYLTNNRIFDIINLSSYFAFRRNLC